MTIQDQPTSQPEWASNPPSSLTSTIVEPSAAQRQKGWGAQLVSGQIVPDPPIRQYFNWWQNLVYKWVLWFSRTVFNFRIFGPDQGLPTPGTSPSIGAGLGPLVATDFSATVIIDGYEITQDGPTSLPFTYANDSDTYWDLARDGTWVPSAVANGGISGAGVAPAIAANAIRCFRVSTVAGARTLLLNLRNSYVDMTTPLDIKMARFGDKNRTSLAAYNAARRITAYKGGGGVGYTAVEYFPSDTTFQRDWYLFVRHSDGVLVLTAGMYYGDSTNTWVPYQVGTVAYVPLGTLTDPRYYVAASTAPIADAVFTADHMTSGGLMVRSQQSAGQFDAGGGLTSEYEASDVADYVAQTSAAYKSRVFAAGKTTDYAEGTATGVNGRSNGFTRGINCTYSSVDHLWHRTAAGDSYAFCVTSDGGLETFVHPAAGTATWDNTSGGGNWDNLLRVNSSTITALTLRTVGGIIAGGDTTVTGNITAIGNQIATTYGIAAQFVPTANASGVKDAISKDMTIKARGVFTSTSGSPPTITGSELANCTIAVVNYTGSLYSVDVTLTNPMASATLYAVDGSVDNYRLLQVARLSAASFRLTLRNVASNAVEGFESSSQTCSFEVKGALA